MNITTAEHGDDYQGELKANFSSNIWYGANNTSLYQYLTNKFIKCKAFLDLGQVPLDLTGSIDRKLEIILVIK